jgi:large subunit ribosomal protein L22
MADKKEVKTAIAKAEMLKTSPRKLNIVAAMIRGMAASKAVTALAFSKRRIAGEVSKVLMSAIANAGQKGMDADKLIVAEAWVGKAVFMRRVRPVSKGRGHGYVKMFSRLTIVVAEQEPASADKPAKKTKKAEKKD